MDVVTVIKKKEVQYKDLLLHSESVLYYFSCFFSNSIFGDIQSMSRFLDLRLSLLKLDLQLNSTPAIIFLFGNHISVLANNFVKHGYIFF
jgi:hypothetical protein